MGGDSCSEGMGLNPSSVYWRDIFTYICCKKLFVWKDENKEKRGQEWPSFLKKEKCKGQIWTLFILCGFSCIAYVEWKTLLLAWSNLNQSNSRSSIEWYFILWYVFSTSGIHRLWSLYLSNWKCCHLLGENYCCGDVFVSAANGWMIPWDVLAILDTSLIYFWGALLV